MCLNKYDKRIFKDFAFFIVKMYYEDMRKRQEVKDADRYLKENPTEIIVP